MKLRHSIGLASVFCVLLASCYPVKEGPGRRPQGQGKTQNAQTPPLTPEQQKVKEAEELKQKEEAKKQAELKKQEELKNGGTEGTPGGTTGPDKLPPPIKDKTDYQFANKVPGKDGFVFSPYNNKVVDVRDIPSGTLVQDPTYPPAEKKYFRVP